MPTEPPFPFIPHPMSLQTYIVLVVMSLVMFAAIFVSWLIYEMLVIRREERTTMIKIAREEIRKREKTLLRGAKERQARISHISNISDNKLANKEFWHDLDRDF